MTASDQRSQSALTSRDFLPRVTVGGWGGQTSAIYLRPQAGHAQVVGAGHFTSLPASPHSGFCSASRKVSRVLLGETGWVERRSREI